MSPPRHKPTAISKISKPSGRALGAWWLTLALAWAPVSCGDASSPKEPTTRASVCGSWILEDTPIVDPTGRFFAVEGQDSLRVEDLSTHQTQEIHDLPGAVNLAFWAGGKPGFFLMTCVHTETDDPPTSETHHEVLSYDLEAHKVLWRTLADVHALGLIWLGRMMPDGGGQRLLLGSYDQLLVLDAATGAQAGSFTPGGSISDMAFLRGGEQGLVAVLSNSNGTSPQGVTVHILDVSDLGPRCQLTSPGIGINLALMPGGAQMFLGGNPLARINADACSADLKLPSSGRVTLSQDGRTAVVPLDRDTSSPDATLPDEVKHSSERYHLMALDTATLASSITPLGDELPAYDLTPDGRTVVIDASSSEDKTLRLLDLATGELRTLEGTRTRLATHVFTPDGRALFVLDSGSLIRVDLSAARADTIELSFSPRWLSSIPGSTELLLGDQDHQGHLLDSTTL